MHGRENVPDWGTPSCEDQEQLLLIRHSAMIDARADLEDMAAEHTGNEDRFEAIRRYVFPLLERERYDLERRLRKFRKG